VNGIDDTVESSAAHPRYRSGFVTLVGRPNTGKSTLINTMVGEKVTIVSDKPQTTRRIVRGVVHRPDAQIVLVDTPGIHKPRTLLGDRLNDVASSSLADVDVVVFVIDATAPLGRGDRFVADLVPKQAICVVNKIDRARPHQVMQQLAAAGELGFSDYFPVSARTGDGVAELIDALLDRLPEGPPYFPSGERRDLTEAVWVAELVREELLAVLHDELPHSVACRVTEWEWPRIRCEILVERSSQKGIVIGHRGEILKRVGTRVRRQLAPGAFLELAVTVEDGWQRDSTALDRLGF
jgi:GTP-binding protein Era